MSVKEFGVWVYCFGKGKASIIGVIIVSAPVVARNLAEQLQIHGFEDKAALITSLVGLVVLGAGLLRKAVGWFISKDQKCDE